MSRIESPGWISTRSCGVCSSGRSGSPTIAEECPAGALADAIVRGATDGPTYFTGRESEMLQPTPGGLRRGRQSVTLELPPVELRRWISPPSRFDNSRLIAKPSPVPPYLRLVLASACI